MKAHQSPARPITNRPWPGWRWCITGLSALGLALSSYLSWHYVRHSAIIGCGGGSPCDEILNSRWSSVGGVVPVSGLAASAYLAMLVCCLSIGTANAAPVRRLAWNVLVTLAVAAAVSAVWFIIVQKWMIRAWCPYCMATHVTSLALAATVLWLAKTRDPNPASPQSREARDPNFEIRNESRTAGPQNRRASVLPDLGASRPPSPVLRPLSSVQLGVALAAALVVAQVGVAPRTSVRSGESQNQLPAVDREAVPLIGSTDARYVVRLLFDYNCPHCQQLHLMLGEAIRHYRGQLAFALCPAPLNRQCNPYVPRDVDEFKDSCALARVALAVWVADRAAFPGFDDWMYSFDSGDRWHPRSLDAAQTKAIELVGRAKFAVAAKDPWVDRYLQTSVRLYGETRQNGQGGVPKLVYGSRWITPEPNTPAELVSLLQTNLRVPKS